MERFFKCGMVIVYVAILLLGLISAMACLAAEFKKTKTVELVFEGKGCEVGWNVVLFARELCIWFGTRCINLPFRCSVDWNMYNWLPFILLKREGNQHLQKGESGIGYSLPPFMRKCFVVNDGVYAASSVLASTAILFMLGCIFTCTATTRNRRAQGEQGRMVHAAAQGQRRDRELQGMKREDEARLGSLCRNQR
ncbi:hypothetical protein ACLOJK_041752 [Asimina triloba]